MADKSDNTTPHEQWRADRITQAEKDAKAAEKATASETS